MTTKTQPLRRSEPAWQFAVLFGTVGFLVGGCAVIYLGLMSATPPPPPPGTVNCGTAALGGWLLLMIGAPLAATASAAVAGALGGVVDYTRSRFRP